MPVRNMFGTLATSESMRYLEDDMDGVLLDIITWMTISLPLARYRVAFVKSIPPAFHEYRMPLRPKAAYKRPRWHLRIYEIDAGASLVCWKGYSGAPETTTPWTGVVSRHARGTYLLEDAAHLVQG